MYESDFIVCILCNLRGFVVVEDIIILVRSNYVHSVGFFTEQGKFQGGEKFSLAFLFNASEIELAKLPSLRLT